MKETYEEKMKRLSRTHYNYEQSDFKALTVEEFEAWKNERDLSDIQLEEFRWRTKEVVLICNSFLSAYKEDLISLNGKKGLLETLRAVCNPHYRALYGKTILEALGHDSKKKRGPSTNRTWLRKHLRFYLSFLKEQKSGPPMLSFPEYAIRDGEKVLYPGGSYEDRISLVLARFHKMGLKDLVPSDATVRELVRADRK